MRAKGRKAARTKQAGNGGGIQAKGCSIVEVPVEVLHQVLGMLSPHDVINVLQTSKAMAREVMQCSAGRLTLSVQLNGRAKLSAVRQLLQWAPPSTLKLKLNGYSFLQPLADHGWGMLSSLLGTPCTASPPNSQPVQHMQQFPGLLAVHMKDFALPGLLPPGLAAAFPNMHTLHLSKCTIHGDNDGCSSGSSSISSVVHTLILEQCKVPGLEGCSEGSMKVTENLSAAAQHAEQLKHGLKEVTCLTLQDCPQAVLQLVSAFGPHLKELHLPDEIWITPFPLCGAEMHLQQLHKLYLPGTRAASDADVELLLSLPSLTHLEIDSVAEDVTTDYSSRPCKCQYLHLHLHGTGLYLDTLAKFPLHSLTHPLRLGREGNRCVEVFLPLTCLEGSRPSLERLVQQLTRCGVQLVGDHVWWENDAGGYLPSAEAASGLAFVAPVIGRQGHVALSWMAVDQAVLEVLVTVYGSSLKQLELYQCDWEEDMQDACHFALSGLPSLHRLTLRTPEDTAGLVHALATAMVQQPAGRCIEVVACNVPVDTSQELIALVKYAVQQKPLEVHITIMKVRELHVHITTKERALRSNVFVH